MKFVIRSSMLFGSRTKVGRVTLVKSMPGRSCEIKCKRMFYTDEGPEREQERTLFSSSSCSTFSSSSFLLAPRQTYQSCDNNKHGHDTPPGRGHIASIRSSKGGCGTQREILHARRFDCDSSVRQRATAGSRTSRQKQIETVWKELLRF